VTATSAAICRLIAYDRPPGPLAVRTLVQALLLSAVMYAFACWRPNRETVEALQRVILRPLRLVLGLPRSCSASDVLAEFNLPPLHRARDTQLLVLTERLSSLPAGHLAADLLRSQRGPTMSNRIPAVARPYDYFVREKPSRRKPPKRRAKLPLLRVPAPSKPAMFHRYRSVATSISPGAVSAALILRGRGSRHTVSDAVSSLHVRPRLPRLRRWRRRLQLLWRRLPWHRRSRWGPMLRRSLLRQRRLQWWWCGRGQGGWRTTTVTDLAAGGRFTGWRTGARTCGTNIVVFALRCETSCCSAGATAAPATSLRVGYARTIAMRGAGVERRRRYLGRRLLLRPQLRDRHRWRSAPSARSSGCLRGSPAASSHVATPMHTGPV
jgi:hypothetical protein